MAQLVGESSQAPKGLRFNDFSEHIPRLQVQCLVQAHTVGNKVMYLSYTDVSLSLSLPLSSLKALNNNNKKPSPVEEEESPREVNPMAQVRW